jgi:hypothetical protein
MSAARVALMVSLLAVLIPACSSGQQCKRKVFTGTVGSESEYSHSFAPNLRFRLLPLKDDLGWEISVNPNDSNDDWTQSVTLPLRGEQQQYMGTGYGDTVQDKMKFPTVVYFVLSSSDFAKFSQMEADRSLDAGELIQEINRLSKGELTLAALSYGKGDTKETIKWMRFRATVVVPSSFRTSGANWSATTCPDQTQ